MSCVRGDGPLPGDKVEGQPEEGDNTQQVGPDVPRLRVNTKDGLEAFSKEKKHNIKLFKKVCLGSWYVITIKKHNFYHYFPFPPHTNT